MFPSGIVNVIFFFFFNSELKFSLFHNHDTEHFISYIVFFTLCEKSSLFTYVYFLFSLVILLFWFSTWNKFYVCVCVCKFFVCFFLLVSKKKPKFHIRQKNGRIETFMFAARKEITSREYVVYAREKFTHSILCSRSDIGTKRMHTHTHKNSHIFIDIFTHTYLGYVFDSSLVPRKARTSYTHLM